LRVIAEQNFGKPICKALNANGKIAEAAPTKDLMKKGLRR